MQFRAGQRPDRLGSLLLAEAERSVGGEGADEGAKVLQPLSVERREQPGKLWVRLGGPGGDRDEYYVSFSGSRRDS